MTNRKKRDVFLSYSSVDQTWVSRLKDALQARGLKVWLDRDEIRPGDLFVGALETGLDESKAVALIVSPESMVSGWVREEYSRALSLSQEKNPPLQLIPVILREAKLPGFLANRNWVDFRDESAFDENLEKLIWGITGKKPSDSSPRPFDKQATKQHPGNAAPIQVEENSADFVLFRANNGQLYFIPLKNANWDSTEISLQLIPETTDESAFLRSLRNNRHTTFAFALWDDADWVSPCEVTQTMSGAQVSE
jgi:hypothetical protein